MEHKKMEYFYIFVTFVSFFCCADSTSYGKLTNGNYLFEDCVFPKWENRENKSLIMNIHDNSFKYTRIENNKNNVILNGTYNFNDYINKHIFWVNKTKLGVFEFDHDGNVYTQNGIEFSSSNRFIIDCKYIFQG